MSAPEAPADPPPSTSILATRGALVYYAFMLPAIVAELVFAAAIASQADTYGAVVSTAAQLLPFAILLASVYAVLSFRPSLLITLLVTSFFVAVSAADGVSFVGTQLDLGVSVVLVVAASYLALVGFNYGRGLKLLKGKTSPDIRSSGPFGYNALGIALESAVPLAAALGLVLLVETIVADLGAQAALLPPPLSTLTSLYLQSRIGLVFTTLFVAGASIWVIRQFIEPVILHFTLTPADARKELLFEIEPTTKSLRKVARYRPSRGITWGVLTAAYCVGIMATLVIFLPQGQLYRDLLAIFDLKTPSPSTNEIFLNDALQNGLVKIDALFAQSQDYLREIIKLLWG